MSRKKKNADPFLEFLGMGTEDDLRDFGPEARRTGRPARAPRTATSATDPIEVGWAKMPKGITGRLGVTFAPGKQGMAVMSDVRHARDLGTDLGALAGRHGADVLCNCMEDFELPMLGIPTFHAEAQASGMAYFHLPIVDVNIPRTPQAVQIALNTVTHLAAAVTEGQTVVVNCRGGRGRSGMIAACTLAALGVFPDQAILNIRAARPGTIETPAQEGFVWQAALRLLGMGWGNPAWTCAPA